MNFIVVNEHLINLDNITNVTPAPKQDWNHLNQYSTNIWFINSTEPLTLNILFQDFLSMIPHRTK